MQAKPDHRKTNAKQQPPANSNSNKQTIKQSKKERSKQSTSKQTKKQKKEIPNNFIQLFFWRPFLRPGVFVFSPNSGYTEGVLTVRVKAGFDQGTLSGPVVSSAQECRFEILCWFRLRRLAQSVGRGNRNFEGVVLPGVRVRFWTWRSFCMAGVRNPSLMEVRNVSLHGRRKESDTLWKSWQAQYFVDVAKTLAGVCHSKDCVLRGKRRESAPWILYFEVKGLNSWEGLHF